MTATGYSAEATKHTSTFNTIAKTETCSTQEVSELVFRIAACPESITALDDSPPVLLDAPPDFDRGEIPRTGEFYKISFHH